MLKVAGEITKKIPDILEKEFLEANGMGSYACSTLLCIPTRRYHSLFNFSLNTPVKRYNFIPSILETVDYKNKTYMLNPFLNEENPSPKSYLEKFFIDLNPHFLYYFHTIKFQKSIIMPRYKNITILKYQLLKKPEEKVRLSFLPFVAIRNHHILNTNIEPEKYLIAVEKNYVRIEKDGIIFFILFSKGEFIKDGVIEKGIIYPVEKRRGLDYIESLYSPGIIEIELEDTEPVYIGISTTRQDVGKLEEWYEKERKRRENLIESLKIKNEMYKNLIISSEFFLSRRKEYFTIIAGYPWFTDWGRDTMISLPGIVLVPKKYDEAKKIFLLYLEHLNKGLIPNFFDEETGKPVYNSVDASLWFIVAVYKYLQYTHDWKFVKDELWEGIKSIIENYYNGTYYNIHMDYDKLIYAGEEGIQLTWMDAKYKERVITQRAGKPVEINALWYNAVRIAELLSARYGEVELNSKLEKLGFDIKKFFFRKFWNKQRGYLNDCVDVPPSGEVDPALRPNQIFAISLPFDDLLKQNQKIRVLNIIKEKLLTPRGIRSLSPDEPGYTGRYEGDLEKRDSAYHNGTVWGFLLGHFITAYLKTFNYSKQARREMHEILREYEKNIHEACIGNFSEIFDGDPPHYPKGCFAQAWSLAEYLRVRHEDFDSI